VGAALTADAHADPDSPAWPRVGGVMIAMLVLTVYFAVVAMTGGYLVSQLLTLRSFEAVRSGLQQELGAADLALFAVKALGLGAIVALSARRAARNPTESVGSEAVGRAFVASLLAAMLYSGAVTVAFYLWRGPPLPP
jgi:ABC-type transporter Mla maintaining outer membrane lipid asymmetry permease subunit MlaE